MTPPMAKRRGATVSPSPNRGEPLSSRPPMAKPMSSNATRREQRVIKRIIRTLNGFGKEATNWAEGFEVKSYAVGNVKVTWTLGKVSGYRVNFIKAVGKKDDDREYWVEISHYDFDLTGKCLGGGSVGTDDEGARLIARVVSNIEEAANA
jgi:hypothetical protein